MGFSLRPALVYLDVPPWHGVSPTRSHASHSHSSLRSAFLKKISSSIIMSSRPRGRSRRRNSRTGRFRKRSSSSRLSNSRSLVRTRPVNSVITGYLKTKQKVAMQFTVPASPSPEVPLNFVFKLSDLPQSTEFRKVFDSYRINSIHITASPLTNSSIQINPGYKLMWAVDLDDTVNETAASIIQRSNVHIKTVTSGGNNPQVFHMKCRPRYLTQLYETDLATGYGQGNRAQWLDCADPNITHFGIKCVFDTDPLLNNTIVWQFYINYYIEFKSLR